MTDAVTATEETLTTQERLPKAFTFSTLLTGLVKMWRGWAPGLSAIVVSALLNTLFVLGDPIPGLGIGFLFLALLSGVVLLAAAAVLTATALESVEHRARFNDVIARVTANLWPFVIWTVGLWLVVLIGYLIFTLPGALLLALSPFITIAAMAGAENPLTANFRAIAARPLRWAANVIVIGLILIVLWVLSALNTFFITGAWSALLASLIIGWFCWWWQTVWAVLYRSTPVGADHV